jgi:hypothetical protein
MRKSLSFLALTVSLILAGCAPEAEVVYIDQSQLLVLDRKLPIRNQETKIRANITFERDSAERNIRVPGLAAKEVAIDRKKQVQLLQERLKSDNEKAVRLISSRLKDFYERELDDLYNSEFIKLVPVNEKITSDYKKEYRVIFDRYAKLRAPILIRLSLVLPIPTSSPLIPIDDPDLLPNEKKSREQMRELQRDLNDLEQKFKLEVQGLEEKFVETLGKQVERLNETIAAKAKEIEIRAVQEARDQVQNFSQEIEKVLYIDPKISLAATESLVFSSPPSTVNPIDLLISSQVERMRATIVREKVQNELQIWLRLRHFELTQNKNQGKDRTAEFLKWRSELIANGGPVGK